MNIPIENDDSWWLFPLKMVIFHSFPIRMVIFHSLPIQNGGLPEDFLIDFPCQDPISLSKNLPIQGTSIKPWQAWPASPWAALRRVWINSSASTRWSLGRHGRTHPKRLFEAVVI